MHIISITCGATPFIEGASLSVVIYVISFIGRLALAGVTGEQGEFAAVNRGRAGTTPGSYV